MHSGIEGFGDVGIQFSERWVWDLRLAVWRIGVPGQPLEAMTLKAEV